MILTKLNYYENKNKENYWEIKDLNFNMLNLIVGLNATGKTRLVRVISALAKIITRKSKLLNGNWNVEFKNNGETYKYELQIDNGLVIYEEIKIGRRIVLIRNDEKGKIYSITKDKKIIINPPNNALTLHVRRDVKEFSFFEDFYNWSDNFIGYNFTNVRPNQIAIPMDADHFEYFENLNSTPYILKKLLNDEKSIKRILDDLEEIGYPLERINVKSLIQPNIPKEILITIIKEKALNCEIDQTQMSQGMFRTLALVIIFEHLIKLQKPCTVIIDDIGEGLDYERSTNLTKILIEKIKNSKIQLIITSNHRFLINAVDLKYLNLLERKGHFVESFNYMNSKKLFDDFKYTGLNNFDLFTGKMYKNGN